MQLQRRHTIKRAGEFAHVKAEGRSRVGRYIVLNTARRTGEEEHSRFGIIATKRVGGAVVRNRQRRRIREILRAHGDAIGEGLDVVIVVKVAGGAANYKELEDDFLRLMRREKNQGKRRGDEEDHD